MPSDSFPLIVGGATAGGIMLAIVVVVLIVFLRRYIKNGELRNFQYPGRHSER